MTTPEDMTKDELAEAYGVSKSQTKSEMLAEIAGREADLQTEARNDTTDPAVQRAKELRGEQ